MQHKINNMFTSDPVAYIITVHLNNLSASYSRTEVEAAILLRASGRNSRNNYLSMHLNNIALTYGEVSLFETASLMKLYSFDNDFSLDYLKVKEM